MIEKIKSKCTDDGGCLVWPLSCCNGHPATRVGTKTMLVRRVVWAELHGEIPAGHIVHMTCTTPLCVEPGHMELTTFQKLGKKLGALGVMSGPIRSAAIARSKRKTHAKLSDDAVRDIRTSNESGVALAEKYGISQAHLSKVRLHKAWREFSSPFNGLGARI